LPTITAPAARAPAKHAASRSAGQARSATALQPAVVGTPRTSIRSLTAIRGPLPGWSSRVIKVAIRQFCTPAGLRAGITVQPRARRHRVNEDQVVRRTFQDHAPSYSGHRRCRAAQHRPVGAIACGEPVKACGQTDKSHPDVICCHRQVVTVVMISVKEGVRCRRTRSQSPSRQRRRTRSQSPPRRRRRPCRFG
jgi:hypothetical protein